MTVTRPTGGVKFRLRALREAATPEWHYPEAKLVWGLRALLVGLAVYSLAVEPRYTTRGLLVTSALWGLVFSAGFAFIPTRRPRTLKAAEAALLLSLAMHVMGHAFGWYDAFRYYDKALHFSVPLVTVLVLYALSQATDWVWDWRRVTPFEVGLYLFAMAVTLGTLWEILEFGMDQIAGTEEQNGLFDTMVDIILDVVGAAIGAAVAALVTRHGRKHGLDEVSEEPKRPYATRAPTANEIK